MTNLRRLDVVRLVAFTLLPSLFPATSWAQRLPPIAEQVAKAYGLDGFGKIEGIRYTFEVPAFKLARSWEWNPKTDTVSFTSKDKEGKPVNATYQRSQLASQSDAIKKQIDPAFINDQYWLLLPLHLVWDGSATVTDGGKQKLPLGTGTGQQLVMKYPSQGGYAPGDTWEFYVGANKRVEQIVYRGPNRPKLLMATFAGNKKAGPLLISTEHRGTADGKPVTISLSNVAVKLTGSETWISAR